MDTVQALKRACDRVRWASGGTVPIDTVLTDLVEPLELWMGRLSGREGRWLTLAEVMRDTRRSRNYFEYRGASGESRLAVWRQAGLAECTEEGIWLVHPGVLDECRRQGLGPEAKQSDAESIMNDLVPGNVELVNRQSEIK